MADEAKVKSFRITDETANKFKEISEQIGGNQQQTLARLIDIFEMQASKSVLSPTIANRIEDLNGYLTAITRIYMDMVESITTCRQTTAAEYSAQITAKDNVIAELQTKIADLQTALQTVEQTAQQTAQQAQAQAAEQVAQAQAELAGANKQIILLQDQIVNLQAQLLSVHTQPTQPTETKETKETQQTTKQRSRKTKQQEQPAE